MTGKTDPGGYVQAYSYDNMGNRSLLVDPDGGVNTYSYDLLSRLATMLDSSNRLYTMQYDVAGRKSTFISGLGTWRRYLYDRNDRVTTLLELTSASVRISTTIDAWDAVGRKVRQTKDGVISTFVYSASDRVVSQIKSGERATFVYDLVGNPLVKWYEGGSPNTMTYDAADRITTMQGGPTRTTFTHDDNGNLTTENVAGVINQSEYDRENRLEVEIDPMLVRTTMTYQGDGLRRSRQTLSGRTTYIWDGNDYLMEKD